MFTLPNRTPKHYLDLLIIFSPKSFFTQGKNTSRNREPVPSMSHCVCSSETRPQGSHQKAVSYRPIMVMVSFRRCSFSATTLTMRKVTKGVKVSTR